MNLESIKKDIEDGLKQSEIAAKHNVSVATLKRFIWSHGIYMGEKKTIKTENIKKMQFTLAYFNKF